MCVLYHYIGECWHHNSPHVVNGTRGQSHKRNEKASSGIHKYTHTQRFLLSMANNFSYLVSSCAQYTYNFLCVVWWADSFVRSCFVLLLHSTALITSNGSIHISMKKEKIGGVSRSINLPSLFFLVAFTCHDICLSPRALAHRFQMYSCHFFFSSSSSSYFAFVRTLLYFSSFIPVLCAMFFRHIC